MPQRWISPRPNVSIASGSYGDYCDTHPMKSTIDALRAKGILTVIASGNEGLTDTIAAPACISTAIPVGSTSKADRVSGFSNRWGKGIIMAPGQDILSSVPGGGYAAMSGTSMAAPHVAASLALLRTLAPTATAWETYMPLHNAGKTISDTRPYRRILIREGAVLLDAPNRIKPEAGWWWTPSAGGRGYFIETQADSIFAASYHYQPNGPAEWAVGQTKMAFGGLFLFEFRRFGGGTSLDGVPKPAAESSSLGGFIMKFSDTRNGMIMLPDGRSEPITRFGF